MARRPKPRALKEATGNPGNRPLPPEVELPDTGEVVRPDFLDERPRAVELWEEMAPALTLLGTLRRESAHLLANWCWLQSSFEDDPDEFNAARLNNLRQFASMLGMDPSSASKFVTPQGKTEDPAESFFKPRVVA